MEKRFTTHRAKPVNTLIGLAISSLVVPTIANIAIASMA
jgi:hypothetical protein